MTPLVQDVTNILAFLTLVGSVFALFMLLLLLTPLGEKGWGARVARFLGKEAIAWTFLIAAGSMVGSLFYSEFAHFAPCELCWIQRGLIYPQAVILLFALFARRAELVRKYNMVVRRTCLVLSLVDFPVAVYNVYLQLGGGAIVPCSATGPSCSYVYFIQYGFVTIPTMALVAIVSMILLYLLGEQYADAR